MAGRIQLALFDPLGDDEPVELVGESCEDTPDGRRSLHRFIREFNELAESDSEVLLSLGVVEVCIKTSWLGVLLTLS